MTIHWRAFSMRIVLSFVSVLFFLALSAAPSIAADHGRALVIGNANYPDADAPLGEPINDARDVAGELGRDGFVVTERVAGRGSTSLVRKDGMARGCLK